MGATAVDLVGFTVTSRDAPVSSPGLRDPWPVALLTTVAAAVAGGFAAVIRKRWGESPAKRPRPMLIAGSLLPCREQSVVAQAGASAGCPPSRESHPGAVDQHSLREKHRKGPYG